MIWLISVLVVAISALIWRMSKGVARHLDFLEKALSDLLRRGFHYGFIVIKISYSNRFIQFRKYINAPGEYGLQFGFPKAKWSLPYFDDVFKVCREIDSGCYVVDDDGVDFLYMECGKDVQKAQLCAKRVLTEVFGVTNDTKLFILLEGAALWDDELIDSPDKYPDESLKTVMKRSRALIREVKKNKRQNRKKR